MLHTVCSAAALQLPLPPPPPLLLLQLLPTWWWQRYNFEYTG
jgi:hypothetical protein